MGAGGLDDETLHLMELHNVLEQRRRLYEKQKAMLGPNAPPEVGIGLAQTLRELDAVQGKLNLPAMGEAVEEAIPDAPAVATEWIVRRIDRDVRKLMGGVLRTVEAQREDSAAWREQQEDRWKEQGKWRTQQEKRWKEQDAARKQGNRRALIVLALVALFQLAGLLVVVWIAATLRAHGL